MENRERESKGNDPILIFYGKRKQKKRRRSKAVGPFWDEYGSLMSLLFDRNSDGQQSIYCNLVMYVRVNLHFCVVSQFANHHSNHHSLRKEHSGEGLQCQFFINYSTESTLAVFRFVCRWALCRGVLPQPIAVFVLVASVISSKCPQTKKMMTFALALVATRTLVENLQYGCVKDELVSHE